MIPRSKIGTRIVIPAVSVARLIVELQRREPVVLRRPKPAEAMPDLAGEDQA